MTDLKQAAQQALEALGKWSSGHDMDAVELNDLIATLDAALEQPEQEQAEPVAWVESPFGDVWKTPPRREWRGLTDTERAAVQYESFKRGLSPLEFMELHEAALRSKNHD
jgi:hypothetical protein